MENKIPLTELITVLTEFESADMGTDEFLYKGNYLRVMTAPAGTLVVGKVHKKETLNVLMKGTMKIVSNNGQGVEEISAPHFFVSKEMTRKIGYAETDVFFLNITETEATDLDNIEEEMFMDDSFTFKNEEVNLTGLLLLT